MPPRNFTSVTLPTIVVDEIKKFLEENEVELRRLGIKRISHVLERSWYIGKRVLEKQLEKENAASLVEV